MFGPTGILIALIAPALLAIPLFLRLLLLPSASAVFLGESFGVART